MKGCVAGDALDKYLEFHAMQRHHRVGATVNSAEIKRQARELLEKKFEPMPKKHINF